MIDIFSAERPAEDVLGRVVRITLGGTEYELTVLTIAGNKRWKATLDSRLTSVLDGLEASDNSIAVFAVLETQVDAMVDLLVDYDTDSGNRPGVLPARDVIEETTYEHELLTAVREVWRAANPFVLASLAAATAALQVSDSSEPTNSSRPRTAGSRKRSKPS